MTIQIQDNKHFGSVLRQRLESKHALGTGLRRMLGLLTDAQLVEVYLENEQQGREYAAHRHTKQNQTIDINTIHLG